MSATDSLQSIIDSLTAALPDAEKFDRGTAAAGTRLRKAAQEGKSALQDLRVSVQATKKARQESE
jgi:hypothetical protein